MGDFVSAHNFGAQPRDVTVTIDFGPPAKATRVVAGTQRLSLPPGGDKDATFEYRTAAAGIVGITLTPHDAFPGDDHAELELPSQPALSVTVYSNEPDLLRPLLAATPRIHAVYRKPEEYRGQRRGSSTGQCNFSGARACYEDALSIARELGDSKLEVEALYSLAYVRDIEGDFDGAERDLREALRCTRSRATS